MGAKRWLALTSSIVAALVVCGCQNSPPRNNGTQKIGGGPPQPLMGSQSPGFGANPGVPPPTFGGSGNMNPNGGFSPGGGLTPTGGFNPNGGFRTGPSSGLNPNMGPTGGMPLNNNSFNPNFAATGGNPPPPSFPDPTMSQGTSRFTTPSMPMNSMNSMPMNGAPSIPSRPLTSVPTVPSPPPLSSSPAGFQSSQSPGFGGSSDLQFPPR